jgi:hypothetical protein
MHVQLHRDYAVCATDDDTQRYSLCRGCNRPQDVVHVPGLDLSHRQLPPIRQVEMGIWMARIFENELLSRPGGQLVIVAVLPVFVGVQWSYLGRDDLAQIELDLPQETFFIQFRVESRTVRERKNSFSACAPPQRLL